MKKTIERFLLAAAILTSGGCATTVRVRSAGLWSVPSASAAKDSTPAVHYMAYWEGQCGGWRSFVPYAAKCSSGDGHVRRCVVSPDNSVQCVDEKALDALLVTNNERK